MRLTNEDRNTIHTELHSANVSRSVETAAIRHGRSVLREEITPEVIMMEKDDFKKEYMADSLVNLSNFVLPDFEMPDPGEGVQNGASDFILREFTNERLFKEL